MDSILKVDENKNGGFWPRVFRKVTNRSCEPLHCFQPWIPQFDHFALH